jgi:hypothetical protein
MASADTFASPPSAADTPQGPRFTLAVNNEHVRKLREVYMATPIAHRPAFLTLTSTMPPEVLSYDTPSAQLAFVRVYMLLIEGKDDGSRMEALAAVSEQLGIPNTISKGPDTDADPIQARFCVAKASLEEWSALLVERVRQRWNGAGK